LNVWCEIGSPSQQVGEGQPGSSDARVELDTEEALRRHHIKVRIARRGVESSEKLGRYRWVVKRTLAWLAKLYEDRTLDVFLQGRILVSGMHCQALRLPVVVLLIAQLYEQVTRFLLENLLVFVGEDVLPVSRNAFPNK
jgi:hypothetical protein